ncbi:hypothetical protein PINS_up022646 [Pythium insidiosum]|nr:hypothetical protein PINS_up022646 [Pythium insidiosum]
MIDENGGYILWVRRGLGEFAGWMNAFNSIASNVCDLPTYPVLFCSYVEAFLASGFGYAMTNAERWLVKGTALLIVFTANAVGMRAVALASVAMSLFVLAPFVLEPLSVEAFNVATWGQVAPKIDWSLFLSTILWNYQGWDSLGCVAGEVKDGGRTYPIAIVIAMVLITINYAFPVAAGIMVEPDFAIWKEGMLETVAMRVGHWLGVWVGAAAVIATLGEFNVVMACSSRALWATADYRMMPRVLATEWDRYGTPIAAVIFQTCTTAVLMSFSFEFLVVLDTFFNKYVTVFSDGSFLSVLLLIMRCWVNSAPLFYSSSLRSCGSSTSRRTRSGHSKYRSETQAHGRSRFPRSLCSRACCSRKAPTSGSSAARSM